MLIFCPVINCWRRNIEVSKYNCGFVCFFYLLPPTFGSHILQLVCLGKNVWLLCLLDRSSFYHYVNLDLSFVIFFVLKLTSSDNNTLLLAFLVIFSWHILFGWNSRVLTWTVLMGLVVEPIFLWCLAEAGVFSVCLVSLSWSFGYIQQTSQAFFYCTCWCFSSTQFGKEETNGKPKELVSFLLPSSLYFAQSPCVYWHIRFRGFSHN